MNNKLFDIAFSIWLICTVIAGNIPQANTYKECPLPRNGVDIVIPY